MAHVQKRDFVFRRNGRVHLNLLGASVQSTTGRRAVHISLQGLYCSCKPVFCSHVTLTGYPLHSLVSPSFLPPVRHRVPSHFNWTLRTALHSIKLLHLITMSGCCLSWTFLDVSKCYKIKRPHVMQSLISSVDEITWCVSRRLNPMCKHEGCNTYRQSII